MNVRSRIRSRRSARSGSPGAPGGRPPLGAATSSLLAVIALFVGLVALAAATGRGPSPDPVLAQVKAKRCASAKVGDIKAVDCRGPRGRRGRRGPRGVRGDAGPRGSEGLAGTNGKQGPRGVPGPKGDPCPPSNPDCKGPQGPPGTDGKDGVDGTDGAPGPAGPAGPAGPSDGYYRNFSTVCPCFNPVSITLPPGKYLITGSSLVYNSDADFQTAGLTLSTGAEKSFRLGGRDANDGELLDVQVEVYDAVTLNAQTTVKLTYGGSFIGGYGQTLSAIKVGDVHVQ